MFRPFRSLSLIQSEFGDLTEEPSLKVTGENARQVIPGEAEARESHRECPQLGFSSWRKIVEDVSQRFHRVFRILGSVTSPTVLSHLTKARCRLFPTQTTSFEGIGGKNGIAAAPSRKKLNPFPVSKKRRQCMSNGLMG